MNFLPTLKTLHFITRLQECMTSINTKDGISREEGVNDCAEEKPEVSTAMVS
ncbi:MAG: hypothetical protein AAB367_02210 [Patescibacteria group bacterium]